MKWKLVLCPIRSRWFTLLRLSQCCAGWPVNSQTGFTSRASSAQAQSLKLPPVTFACVRPSSRCATTLTFVRASLGSATSQTTWAVMPGSSTMREDAHKNSRPRRRNSFKGEGATGLQVFCVTSNKYIHWLLPMYLLGGEFQKFVTTIKAEVGNLYKNNF